MSPKIIDKDIKKNGILGAAMRVIARRGFRDVTIAEIAEAAGIGKGTVYEYFESKDDILAGAFDKFRHEVGQVQISKMKNLYDPADRLKALIDSWIEVLGETSFEYLELLTDFWAEGIRSRDSESKKLFSMAQVYSEYRGQIAPIIESGIKKGVFRDVDPHETAAFLIGALDGIILQWMLDKRSIDLTTLSDSFFNIFLRGIALEQ